MSRSHHFLLSHPSYLLWPLRAPEFETPGRAGLRVYTGLFSRLLWLWHTGQASPVQDHSPMVLPPLIQTLLLSLRPLPQPPHALPTLGPPAPAWACVNGASRRKLRFNHAILLLDITTHWPQLLVRYPRSPQSSVCLPAQPQLPISPTLTLHFLE